MPPVPRRLWSRRAALAAASVMLSSRLRAAEEPQRIVVLGDSQAQGLAGALQRLFRGDKAHRVLDRSKISTGLVSLTAYDWPAQAQTIADAEHADVAVALFGANDRPPVRVGGQVDQARFAQFREVYAARVAKVAACFKAARVPLIWIGHPIVRDTAYTDDMALLNGIYKDAAQAEGAIFLSTWDIFKDAEGGFSLYGKGPDGQTTRLRADDGVHLTAVGYDLIASKLSPEFNRLRAGHPQGPSL